MDLDTQNSAELAAGEHERGERRATSDAEWIRHERTRRIVGFIGGYLLEDGAITLSDLDRGLDLQLHLASQGREMRLGEVLIEMNIITPEQLERALARQARDAGTQPGRERAGTDGEGDGDGTRAH